jgi:hypothetical protein
MLIAMLGVWSAGASLLAWWLAGRIGRLTERLDRQEARLNVVAEDVGEALEFIDELKDEDELAIGLYVSGGPDNSILQTGRRRYDDLEYLSPDGN